MAVQAQYPSNIPLPDFCMRTRQPYAGNVNRTFPNAMANHLSLEDFFQVMNGGGSAPANQNAVLNSIVGSVPLQQNAMNGSQFIDEFVCANTSNKRPRQSEFLPQQQHHLQQEQQTVEDFHRNFARPQNTGLRLGLSSPQPPATSTLSLLSEEIAMELQRQREEIEQLMRAEQDRLRRAVEEKQQQQSRALLGALERFVARRIRQKDLELQKLSCRNIELEERVNRLTVEAGFWQNKAKTEELMAANLRNSLQQLNREHQEGVGDSRIADDAESSHPDEEALDEKRASCRVCKTGEVCILLLPCRHLCLCKECESGLDSCPLCKIPKKATVQVFLS